MDRESRSKPTWNDKPIAIIHSEFVHENFLGKLERFYRFQSSGNLLPFSLFIPSSETTFLLIDFVHDFKHWTEDETSDQTKIKWLADFITGNKGPNIVYLCSTIDDFFISVTYDIQRSVEQMTSINVTSGFATSWKAAAKYIHEMAKKHSLSHLELEFCMK